MQIVIDIPEENYKNIKKGFGFRSRVFDAIKNGTPLPKGHWIYDDVINNWKCSECNETPKTLGYVGDDKFMNEHFKFCNHCGANMRGDE